MKETNLFGRFVVEESGQGIAEYGAILAFVAVLVVVVFQAANGGLKGAISAGFSACIAQMNLLAGVAS